MTEKTETKVTATRGAPFGAVYFGVILVVIGMVVVAGPAQVIGAVIALSGVILACTGMIQRSIYRIR